MTISPTLQTQNEAWGYYGTIGSHADSHIAWCLASEAIAAATGFEGVAVRDFLDSTQGRHFANDVADGLHYGQALHHAIEAAVRRWMGWTISKRETLAYGMPKGLPYLTGWVGHFEVLAAAA